MPKTQLDASEPVSILTKTSTYKAIRISTSSTEHKNENLVIEEALRILINGQPFSITMQTPGDEKELVTGLLYSEGIVDHSSLESIKLHFSREASIPSVDVHFPDFKGLSPANKKSLLSVASCGICGNEDIQFVHGEQLEEGSHILSKKVMEMFVEMRGKQDTFDVSGGSHAAAIFDASQKLLCVKEDVGRHNAVDKAVGQLLMSKSIEQAQYLLISGRVSYEIIVKCFKAKIPILAAVSAPSSLSVDFACELGITLLAFCRNDRFTIYSHPERINEVNFKSK